MFKFPIDVPFLPEGLRNPRLLSVLDLGPGYPGENGPRLLRPAPFYIHVRLGDGSSETDARDAGCRLRSDTA